MREEGAIRVGIQPLPPYSYPCLFQAQTPCRKNRVGVNVDMVSIFLTQLLGFANITFVQTFQIPGGRLRNGSDPQKWGGPLGMLARKEIEMSGSLVYVDDARDLGAADFSHPVLTSRRGLLFRTPDYLDTSPSPGSFMFSPLVFLPLDPQVWFSLIGTISVYWLLTLLTYSFHRDRRRPLLWVLLGLGIFFLSRHYRCNFYASRVLLHPPSYPYNDLRDLIEAVREGKAVFTTRSYRSGSMKYINSSSYPLLKTLRRFILKNSVRVIPNRLRMLEEVSRNRTLVTMTSASTYEAYVRVYFCNLTFVPISTGFRFLSFAFPQGSSLLKKLNAAMYNSVTSANEINLRLVSYYSRPRGCGSKGTPLKKDSPIRLQEVALGFLCYGILTLFAGILGCGLEHISLRSNSAIQART